MSNRMEFCQKKCRPAKWVAEQCSGVLENAGIPYDEKGCKYLRHASTMMVIFKHCGCTPNEIIKSIAQKEGVSVEAVKNEMLKSIMTAKNYLLTDELRKAFCLYFHSDLCGIEEPEAFVQEVANIVSRF